MKKYYEIPQNITYEQFARAYIYMNFDKAKYVHQFSLSEKNILYVGTEIFQFPEKSSEISSLKNPEHMTNKTLSQVCCSIRLDDLLKRNNPYEIIAKKINNFPYKLNDAVLHTDQYGIQRLILY